MSFLRRFSTPQIIVAASVPFVGYGLAFMYERGYAGRYGIPMWMTRVTLLQTLIASITVALLVAATPFIASTLSRVASQWTLRLLLAPVAALAVALWAASETQWVMGKHLLIPVVLIGLFGGFAALRIHNSIVTPLIGKSEGAWMDRLKGSAMRGNQSPRLPGLAWMGHRLRWTLAVLVVALCGANWYGNYASRTQRSFLVSSSGPTCVAVRKNADGILCAMTDVARRRVMPQLRVLPPTAAEKLTLATLPALRSPLDADRKLFAPPRRGGVTGTVYAARREPEVTQAGRPRIATATKPAAKPAAKPTTKKKAAAKKRTAKKRR